MIDAITNILLGAVGSILATLILFLLSSLLDLKYKEKFYTQLELAKTAVYQIANMHRYPTDYPLIMQQVDVLYLSCNEMSRCLYPLSLLLHTKKKKMIQTLLYDIIQNCERIKYTTIGYDGDAEINERLKKVHQIFYKVDFLTEWNQNTLTVQLEVIEDLLHKKTFENTFRNIYKKYYGNPREEKNDFYENISSQFIDSFSFKVSPKYTFNSIQSKGLTSLEYKRIVTKIKQKRA